LYAPLLFDSSFAATTIKYIDPKEQDIFKYNILNKETYYFFVLSLYLVLKQFKGCSHPFNVNVQKRVLELLEESL